MCPAKSRWLVLVLSSLVLLWTVAACGGRTASPAAPPDTSAQQEAVATVVPPTASPVQPTATPAPTATPTAVPSLSAAEVGSLGMTIADWPTPPDATEVSVSGDTLEFKTALSLVEVAEFYRPTYQSLDLSTGAWMMSPVSRPSRAA